MTDLRARDNLSKDESYFLAEVRQLRRMVLSPADGRPVLGLIDEPFRGTNSQEQVAASLSVVEHLQGCGDFYLAATHERRLATLADEQAVKNYHFTEELKEGGLVFDYRLRPGPAQTRNALRVLEREGYPDELLNRAYRWMEKTGEGSEDGEAVER